MSTEEKFTCGRRRDMFASGRGVEGADEWEKDGTCSYCGSVSPEFLFDAISRGVPLTPTDKNYKVYVDGSGRGKFYFQHFDEAQQQRFIDLLNENAISLASPGYFYSLPFFATPAEDSP